MTAYKQPPGIAGWIEQPITLLTFQAAPIVTFDLERDERLKRKLDRIEEGVKDRRPYFFFLPA